MPKLPHLWPLGSFFQWAPRSSLLAPLKLEITRCFRFILEISYPKPGVSHICLRSSCKCKILFRKTVVWPLGVFIVIGLVIVSVLFWGTELGNARAHAYINIEDTWWVLKFVSALSLFNFVGLTSVRFPLYAINLWILTSNVWKYFLPHVFLENFWMRIGISM